MTHITYDKTIGSKIIARFDARPEMLIQILHEFLERFGWISEDAVRQLAGELNLSRAEVHGVVSFYHDFRREPAGRHIVKICQAESCQAMGSRQLTAHAEKKLGVALEGTTGDSGITLEPVYCLGNCACSPAIMIDDRVFGRVDAKRFDGLVAALDGADV